MSVYTLLSESERNALNRLEGDESKRLFMQEFFKRNFRAFVYLLGYRDLGKFHEEEIEKLSKVRKLEKKPSRRLWMWSRGFFKTSLITEAHTAWLIVNNPDIRILIVSFSLSVAVKPFGVVRNFFAGHNEFRYFFREYCPKANEAGKVEFGTTEYFTVPNRSIPRKEPTLMCAGVGTNITGLHFDYMKIDDLVNKDSVSNDTQIQASKDYYALLRPIYDNATLPREDVIGTLYHFNDLHSDLLKNPLFEKSIRPCHDDNGNFTFPERIGPNEWAAMLEDPALDPWTIQSQWQLRPMDPSKAVFQESWITYYDHLPEGLAEYITVDPASTQKKKSDYTVIMRWGVDAEGKHYLLEGVRDRLTSFQRIDELFRVAKNAKDLKWVKYEVLGGRHGDLEVIRERQLKTGCFFIVKETRSTNSSKEDRVRQRLQGPYHAKAVLWPRSLVTRSLEGKTQDFIQLLKLEFLQFPFSEHDDILDCQSQMFEEETIKGTKVAKKEERKGITADMEEQIYRDYKKTFNYNPYIKQSPGKKVNRILHLVFKGR